MSNNNYPAAYQGGGPVSKVLHLNDGGTVTITCTGEVVKSPVNGTSPYREGWVDTSTINTITSGSDLNGTGRIKPGSTNPYGSANVCPTKQVASNLSSSSSSNQSKNQPTNTTTTNTYRSTSSTTNNTIILAGETSPAPATTTTTISAPVANSTSLPNTGPGNIAAIGGLTTVFTAVGHYIVQRRRLA